MLEARFTKRSYYNAAQEHLILANDLMNAGQHFAAHYFAGVAIEAILRAHGGRENETFDSSHSLNYWGDKSQLAPNTSAHQDIFYARLAEANLRWRANQRYMTLKMLDTHLFSIGLDKIRGDRIKYSANRLIEIATMIVGLGVEKWKQ